MANLVNARKTHCDHGHEFTAENTYWTPAGHRACRACRNAFTRASHAEKRRLARVARERTAARAILGLPERFWSQARFRDQGYQTPCLIWTGTIAKSGYGVFAIARRQHKAHRLAHEAVNGPIPIDDETGKPFPLDHICHNDNPTCAGGGDCPHRRCVNPSHTEAVTDAVNVMRGMSFAPANAAKTHCDHGHEFTSENTIRDGDGHRSCRECKRGADRRRDARKADQRRVLRALLPPRPEPPKAPPRELAPCGTLAARLRHIRHGEPIDAACRAAHAESMRKWKQGRAGR